MTDADAPAASPSRIAAHEDLDAAYRRLWAQNADLATLLRAQTQSAELHAARAAVLTNLAAERAAQMAVLRRSTSWRLTAPLRLARLLLGGRPAVALPGLLQRVVEVARADGIGAAGRKAVAYLRRRLHRRPRIRLAAGLADQLAPYRQSPVRPPRDVLTPGVAIIAELSVPQCAKYRVWQKQEHLASLGIRCIVVDWRDRFAARSALQLSGLAIFYRVPGTPEIRALIAEAHRLGVAQFWEVDDLIFDEALYRANRNLATLDAALQRNLIEGVRLYRAGLLASDAAIASTPALAEVMREAGMRDVRVIENALDAETLAAASEIRADRISRADGTVLVTYGSGTKTHDHDFACAAPALAALMARRPEMRLRIVGELTLPAVLEGVRDRIEHLPPTGYRAYLEMLGESDISLAPLEPTRFNDCKSNIKFLEAAILGVPSVCSPRENFRAVIRDGENGLLAETTDEWTEALERLATDPALREEIGAAALRTARERYAPAAIARQQVAPLVADLDGGKRAPLRVLLVNIFFAPRSFGGATIVAEEMARRLHARADTEVVVFTSQDNPEDAADTLLRYEIDGMPVIGVRVQGSGDTILDFDNPRHDRIFAELLDAVAPDVVHFHSIQAIGASVARVCRERGVPYVVTLHDAWWLCERQFMVRADDRYCFQTKIDLRTCQACIPTAAHLRQRYDILTTTLRGAALLLTPSAFHRSLYIANDLPAERIVVNPNGIRPPATARPPRAPGPLRFGYVGGNERVKGIHVLRAAFEALDRTDYTLVMVDNTLNLGYPSLDIGEWQIGGRVEIIPAYRQETLDGFFAGIDVLLFPSQWKESFGLTVREAMARDVWVVVTAGGGAAEAVTDGVNGTVIPLDGRHEPLAAAITALLAAPERLVGYVNPLKNELPSFAAQAEQLHDLLLAASRTHPSLVLPDPAADGAAAAALVETAG